MSDTGLERIEAELRELRRLLDGRVEKQAVNFTQAAEALNVSPRHISRMVRRGSLMTVDIDGARRIPMSEIRRVASAPTLSSSGATPERVRFDAAAAVRRLDELRKKKPKKPMR